MVSSGTESGKTECFLVPILNDLVRARQQQTALTGVRALFLYPLNALINSQRDRLRAWSAPFGGALRFCLYNGETPETVPAHLQRETPEQVQSRQRLRDDPPPILVTNATMLDYMLVRKVDRPIIEASKGQLSWIVLDEAHTYVGSQAAEIALLLRRVMHTFDVRPDQVRFIATSATIGEDKGDELQRFLADLAGVSLDRVRVVRGKRQLPELDPAWEACRTPLPSLDKLESMDATTRFQALASNDRIRWLRQHLKDHAMRVSDISKKLGGKNRSKRLLSTEVIRYLDMATRAEQDGDPLLPLRMHLFHRTQMGLWVCANVSCEGRHKTALDHADWPFGKVFLSRKSHCDVSSCHAPVFELVLCSACGAEYLAATETRSDTGSILSARSYALD